MKNRETGRSRRRGACALFAVIVGSSLLVARAATAATITAQNCTENEVAAKIASANAGDTVNVPAGSCAWTQGMTFTKHVSLIGGHGGGETVITLGDSIVIDPDRTVADDLLRVSHFTFSCGDTNPCVWLGNYELSYNPGFPMVRNVRFDHNTFTNIGNYAMKSAVTFYGLVDHNAFGTSMNDPCTTDCMWNEANASNAAAHDYWQTPPQNHFALGSDEYVYYEDNVFYSTVRAVVNQWASRGTYRYNTVHSSGNAEFEVHGHQGDLAQGDPAGFAYEMYGNDIVAGSAISNIRSGENMIFYNNTSGTPSIQVYCDQNATTCADFQPAMQMTHGNYYWRNRAGYTGPTEMAGDNGWQCSYSCGGNSGPIPQGGRDYFNSDTSATHTTPSVGCGPSLPATCAANQGYWLTTQSCADLTGMVGPEPATPIAGTLYKCTTQNAWVAYYTPFTYPHPLQGSGGDAGAPSDASAASDAGEKGDTGATAEGGTGPNGGPDAAARGDDAPTGAGPTDTSGASGHGCSLSADASRSAHPAAGLLVACLAFMRRRARR